MTGPLKSVLALGGLWVGGGVLWVLVVGIGAGAAGNGMGPALTAAMVTAWGSALGLSLAVVGLGGVLAWRWMPPGPGRVGLLLALAGAQVATLVLEVFSVFVIFNR